MSFCEASKSQRPYTYLGGGFKYVYFTPTWGDDPISDGLKVMIPFICCHPLNLKLHDLFLNTVFLLCVKNQWFIQAFWQQWQPKAYDLRTVVTSMQA